MCKKCDSHYWLAETVRFRCGLCAKFVETKWAWCRGLLHGDYQVIGEVIFHDSCAEEYLRPLNDRVT
jgi:hypothetical protein